MSRLPFTRVVIAVATAMPLLFACVVDFDSGPTKTEGGDASATDGASASDVALPDPKNPTDGGMAKDATLPPPSDGGSCDAGAPFKVVLPMKELDTSANENNISLTRNEQVAVFTRSTILYALRAGSTGTFGNATDTKLIDQQVSVNRDATFLITVANTTGTTGLHYRTQNAFVASAATYISEWASLDGYNPYQLGDDKTVYFAGGAGPDIYRAQRSGTSFGTPVQVTVPFAGGGGVTHPVVSEDERVLYFTARRPGDSGGAVGSGGIWIATRSIPTGAFGTPVFVSELDTGRDDFPMWLSTDMCRLYVAQRNAVGDLDLGVATR